MAHKPAGSTLHNRCTPREPVRASDQAADLSSDQVRQHLAVGRQVGHDLLETTVLILELLDTLHLGRQQTGILILPANVGRRADPDLAANLGNRRTFLALFNEFTLNKVFGLRRWCDGAAAAHFRQPTWQ